MCENGILRRIGSGIWIFKVSKEKKDIINIVATLYGNRLKSAPIKRGLSNLQINT
jgi:hypothetical protein